MLKFWIPKLIILRIKRVPVKNILIESVYNLPGGGIGGGGTAK